VRESGWAKWSVGVDVHNLCDAPPEVTWCCLALLEHMIHIHGGRYMYTQTSASNP